MFPELSLLYELLQIELAPIMIDTEVEYQAVNKVSDRSDSENEADEDHKLVGQRVASETVEEPGASVHGSTALLVTNEGERVMTHRDLLKATDRSKREGDVGNMSNAAPTDELTQLESSEQNILQQLKNFIGDKPVSENRPQFAPRWIIDKEI